jgi:hypothetical protein
VSERNQDVDAPLCDPFNHPYWAEKFRSGQFIIEAVVEFDGKFERCSDSETSLGW